MLDILSLKGGFDHKVSVGDFPIIGGEKHVLEDGIGHFLFEDLFFSCLDHFGFGFL